MISILAWIFLAFRRSGFMKLKPTDLPNLGESDFKLMRKYTNTAYWMYLCLAIFSLFPYLLLTGGGRVAEYPLEGIIPKTFLITKSTANILSTVIGIVAFIPACVLDWKAEHLKKQGKSK